jgi:hypothetical protein
MNNIAHARFIRLFTCLMTRDLICTALAQGQGRGCWIDAMLCFRVNTKMYAPVDINHMTDWTQMGAMTERTPNDHSKMLHVLLVMTRWRWTVVDLLMSNVSTNSYNPIKWTALAMVVRSVLSLDKQLLTCFWYTIMSVSYHKDAKRCLPIYVNMLHGS